MDDESLSTLQDGQRRLDRLDLKYSLGAAVLTRRGNGQSWAPLAYQSTPETAWQWRRSS